MSRGFDLADESSYLLNFHYPAEYEASFSTFHLIVARLLGLANDSVFTARAVGLGAVVLGAVVFGLSLAAWLRATSVPAARRWVSQLGLLVSFVLLSSLLVSSVSPGLFPAMTLPACRYYCQQRRRWQLCGVDLERPLGSC